MKWVALLWLAGCGTHLSTLDARAQLNQERVCAAIVVRANDGPVEELATSCVCGAVGILKRAGKSHDDAGTICPP